MAKSKIYGLTEKAKRRVEKTVARSEGGFRRRRPVNKRRRGTGGGDSSKLVAIVESISAASASVADGKSTITHTGVTAKSLATDSNGKRYYDPSTATDVECEWHWATAVTVAAGRWKLGEVVGGRLHLVDCGDFATPAST